MNLAPNGKPSNLTSEQYKLVRTPAFKKWFGDWENEPENASKVVDENGEPLVVYHGTNSDFNVFKEGKIGLTDKGWYGYGYYFSPSTEMSNLYGSSKPYFLKIKKIFNTNKENPFYLGGREVTENYIDKGYDGSSKTFDVNKLFHEYCVFFKFPNNIKLADGTNTTFDSKNPDIRYEKGGEITLLKNKIKAPYFKKMYGQDVEPTGYYAIKKETDIFDSNPNYETKKIKFVKPLYIEVDADSLISWKYDLSKKFKAKGKKLTDKLLNEGYDVIITHYSNGDTGEIIVLNPNILYEKGGLIDDTFTLTEYIITIGDDMYSETQYKGNDYDIALREYNNISPSDFVNKNSTSNYKTLEKGYTKYKFIGEIEDDYEIADYIDDLDDSSYWKIIEESDELETLLVDNVEGINESTDDIIKDIQEFINDEYGDSRYGSKYMNIKIYDDDESIDTITIRVADHSQNPRNIKNEHHLSFVIANENATKSRFRSNYEYYFDDSDDIDYIKAEIKKIIDEKIQDIKEKKYETGGNIKFTYTIGGL